MEKTNERLHKNGFNGSAQYKLASFCVTTGASILDHLRTRHKMYTIKEIIKERKEWCEQFNDYPYDYWKKRWDFLSRRLNNYSDMARSLQRRTYIKQKEEQKVED